MRYQISVCKKGDSEYPKAFNGIKGMPELLYYRGDISILNKYKCIAIVGSRKCSDTAITFAHDAGDVASKLGYVVANGLALGCDTAAIRGVLLNKGKCVAVMPCGLNHVFPKSNATLVDSILECGGLLISEYDPGMLPRKYTYVQRDRLQSALAQAVLLVEADADSGSRYALEAAVKQERRIFTYAYDIVKSGLNKVAEDRGALPIHDTTELEKYLMGIEKEPLYEQISLFG